jgi:hypothetical protein
MTEEQAKTKWCPFSRNFYNQGPYNRTPWGIDKASMCIGSECMAWRWVKDPVTNLFTYGKELPDYEGEHGYCGLAGKYYV